MYSRQIGHLPNTIARILGCGAQSRIPGRRLAIGRWMRSFVLLRAELSTRSHLCMDTILTIVIGWYGSKQNPRSNVLQLSPVTVFWKYSAPVLGSDCRTQRSAILQSKNVKILEFEECCQIAAGSRCRTFESTLAACSLVRLHWIRSCIAIGNFETD